MCGQLQPPLGKSASAFLLRPVRNLGPSSIEYYEVKIEKMAEGAVLGGDVVMGGDLSW